MTLFAEKTLESTTTTGTGAYGLDGAPSGFRTFVTAFGTGNLCAYHAQNEDGSIWEAGLGTVTDATPDTLTRTTLLGSSTGSAINWGAGTKYIYSVPSGVILSSLLKGNIGSSRPAWLEAGGQWIDNSGTPWEVNLYDGTDDTLLYKIDMSTGDITFGADVTIESTDADAGAAPTLNLDRDSASPAASDSLGRIDYQGRNASDETKTYARIAARLLDPTASAEDGDIQIATMVAGALAAVATFGQGVTVGGATGGDKGPDTINASSYYQDGTLIRNVIESSTATNGYFEFDFGLIIQWGRSAAAGTSAKSVTFTTPFPNACFVVMVTVNGSTGGSINPEVTIPGKTSFTIHEPDSRAHYWLAIGN